VLRAARRDGECLAVGLDTDAAAMREASHRAARPQARGGLPNALFLAADGLAVPDVFHGRLDEARITLPWGALLRATLAPDADFGRRVVATLRPTGVLRLFLSLTERDARGPGILDEPSAAEVVARWQRHGLRCRELRPATASDVANLGSTWAKRLGIPARRPAWVILLGTDGAYRDV
jgi:hypothetical protein